MTVRYEVSVVVRDAPERVWAWWTDYGPVGHAETVGHGIGKARREVLARDGERIVLRESAMGMPFLHHEVELHPERRAFRETSELYDAWWSFEAHPEGTLVRREVEVHPRGAARFTPRALARWAAQKDLEHHAKAYEREKGHFR
ncbi:MAG TPA: hypothetical protein VM582_08670 [Candidatus Thermoplasmatota archaeon]|nr:hypothetical protein [Candidatus Thermoplasmatota archaeon]